MLKNNIDEIINEVGFDTILPVTKYMKDEDVLSLIDKGFKRIAENRVDNILERMDLLKDYKDIEYHLIGHLQKNKVNKIINKIDCLHSLDSLNLAQLINTQRIKPLDCFIELKLVPSDTKSGILCDEIDSFLESLKKYDKINIIGFMAMTNKDMSDDERDNVFKKAYELKNKYNLKYLSIGMSNDYKIALKYNPKYVRLGHALYEDKNEK